MDVKRLKRYASYIMMDILFSENYPCMYAQHELFLLGLSFLTVFCVAYFVNNIKVVAVFRFIFILSNFLCREIYNFFY